MEGQVIGSRSIPKPAGSALDTIPWFVSQDPQTWGRFLEETVTLSPPECGDGRAWPAVLGSFLTPF